MSTTTMKMVDVKSAWASKINWAQLIAFVAMMLAAFGINLDADTQVAIVAGIAGVGQVITWYLRTFRTNTVTPSAATKI